jgi:phage tail-like protein
MANTTTITPADEKTTPLISSRFTVEFGDLKGAFTEVSGLNIDIEEVESVVTKDGKDITRWTPGTVKYSEVTIKREFTGDKGFWKWHDDMAKNGSDYRNGSVTLNKINGEPAGVSWTIQRCWPSKWSCSDLDAGSGDVMIEEITLQIEFLERVKG